MTVANTTISLEDTTRNSGANTPKPRETANKFDRQINRFKDMGYEVHITHLRQFERKNGATVLLQKHHRTADMKLCSCGGMTIVTLVNRGEDTAIPSRLQAVSECVERDNFCYKVGRGIAIGRLNKELGMIEEEDNQETK